jgi:hypothetical protein
MSTSWPLKMYLDCAEPRVDLGRIAASVDGTNWDRALSDTTTYIDPVTNTAMLAPLPLTAAWETTFTGSYERIGQTNLVFPTPAKWKVNQIRASGDFWHESQGVAEVVETRFTPTVNQAMHVAAYIDGVGSNANTVVLECGWGRGTGVEVKLRSNGTYLVYKGGVLVGEYTPEAATRTTQRVAKTGNDSRRKFVALTMIPLRVRDLLIIDANGSAIVHTFADLPAWDQITDSTPPTIITPDSPFYIYAPVGKAAWQMALVNYETSGSVYSKIQRSRYPWPSGASSLSSRYYGHNFGPGPYSIVPTFSLADAAGNALTLDGTQDEARIKITMAGDGTRNIGIYSADVWYGPTYTTTVADAEVDVTCAIESLSWDVGEDGRVRVSMSARRKNLADAGVDQPEITGNRPFRIAVEDGATPTPGEIDVVRGTLGPPSIEYIEGDKSADHDWSLLSFVGGDRNELFDRTWIPHPLPYDNVAIDAVVEDLVSQAGIDPTSGDIDVDDVGVGAALSTDISLGKFAVLPDRGDTIGQWLDKIHADYCSTWLRAWVPTDGGLTYRWVDVDAETPTPVVTLYPSLAAAAAASVTALLRPNRIYRSLSQVRERPEANQVQVVGQDPHTGQVLSATYNDDLSQDPSLSPASRPANWVGFVEPVLYQDPALNSTQAIGNVGLSIAHRVMPGRNIVEWEADLIVSDVNDVPLWLGDVVTINGPDNVSIGNYRIVAMPMVEILREHDSGVQVRRARYRAVEVRTQELEYNDGDNSGWLWLA